MALPMKVLLIDAMSIIRRVYEAIQDSDHIAKAESAATSSVSSIKRALKDNAPTHVLCAFDSQKLTWRHEVYAAYKANREPTPAALVDRLPQIKSDLLDIGLTSINREGVEADDIIATVTSKLSHTDAHITIASTDKDLLQLVNGNRIVLRDHFTGDIKDKAWVEARYGVAPELIGDLLALVGDSSDNIPGVHGIGIKTAATLLQLYGSLDEIIFMKDVIAGKTGEKIRTQISQARLSKELVSLKTDIDLGITLNSIKYNPRS